MAFEALPLELKTMIFSNFTTSELASIIVPVSAKWKNIAMQPALWKELRLSNSEYSPEEIVNILNHSFLAKRVAFIDFKSILSFPKPLTTNNNLRKLELIRCRFTNDELSKLVNAYPNVQTLNLKQSGADLSSLFPNYFINSLDIDTISTITQWKFLKSLKLFDFLLSVGCTHDKIIVKIMRECNFLEKIRVNANGRINDGAFRHFMRLKGPQLKVIELRTNPLCTNISRHLYQCQNLKKLILHNCPMLKNADFVNFSKFPLLKQLKLYWCSLFQDNNFSALENFEFCQLEELDMIDSVDFTEHIINTCFPRLKKLNQLPVEDYIRLYSNVQSN